ncbi:ubiquinol-cytochrome C chaperone-domain-containing protein [Xylogone sp. PMI_703]|nr:ubiquinol-cytochrome C chaperone-domain-containing protein [Xylogone sp. PMI_703]
MATKACASCLRILQRQSRAFSDLPLSAPRTSLRFPSSRSFTAASRRFAQDPAQTTTSIPPEAPENSEQPPEENSIPAQFRTRRPPRALLKVASGVTETYTAYGVTEDMYKQCAIQADYSIAEAADNNAEVTRTEDGEDVGVGSGWWYTELDLKPTFSTWSQVTMLHMYLLTARFRCFSQGDSQIWQQHLLDHFFYDAENRMVVNHNIHARGARNSYLKDLYIQWRGLLAAYDEGVMKGDAVLAAAVWRNIFKANEDVDIKGLAQIVSLMRRTLKDLDELDELDFKMNPWEFGNPAEELKTVELKSSLMDRPFEKEPVTSAEQVNGS